MLRISPYVYPGMKLDKLTSEILLRFGATTAGRLSVDEVMEVVSKALKVPVYEMIGPSRYREYVEARRILIYHLRKTHYNTHKSLGRKMGNRDHTTIIHNLKMYDIQMKFDPCFKKKAEQVADILQTDSI